MRTASGAPIEASLEPLKEAFEVFEKRLNDYSYTNPVDKRLVCFFCEGWGLSILGPSGVEPKAGCCCCLNR